MLQYPRKLFSVPFQSQPYPEVNADRFTMLFVALLSMRKSAKLSLTQSEKYTEPGYILEYHPARLAIGTEMIAPGVWLGSGGRVLEAQEHVAHTNFNIFFAFLFCFFCACLFRMSLESAVTVLYSPRASRRCLQIQETPTGRCASKKNAAAGLRGAPCCSCRRSPKSRAGLVDQAGARSSPSSFAVHLHPLGGT